MGIGVPIEGGIQPHPRLLIDPPARDVGGTNEGNHQIGGALMTPVDEIRRRDSTPGALRILRDLFERIHEKGIRYCHWKSNEHVDASLTGATDVDVLVERKAAQQLAHLLTETPSFKRFVVKPGHGYPGIEDYVGFDSDTGKLTHLHIHFQLTLGEKFLKGHRLPWEELYLSTRVFDGEHGIYITDPNLELLVLIVRAVMKLRARDVVLEILGKPFFRGDLLREFRWLTSRIEPERLLEVGSQLVGPRAAKLTLEVIAAHHPSLSQLRTFRSLAEPRLHEYRLYGTADAARRMSAVEWSIVLWKIKHWYLGTPTRSNRTIPQGGLLVAVLGATGAGKSTLTGEIGKWLSREAVVTITSSGSGDEPVALPGRILHRVRTLWRRAFEPPARQAKRQPRIIMEPAHTGWLRQLLLVRRLIRERRQRASRIRRGVGRGMIVLSDRFPQRQFVGGDDGPQLTQWLDGNSRFRQTAARREQESFGMSELIAPNLVVKLNVSPQVARQRKPETMIDQLHTDIEFVRQLRFQLTTRVLEVDADQPFAHVLLEVKRAIWECI
jgi:hypothetical protein